MDHSFSELSELSELMMAEALLFTQQCGDKKFCVERDAISGEVESVVSGSSLSGDADAPSSSGGSDLEAKRSLNRLHSMRSRSRKKLRISALKARETELCAEKAALEGALELYQSCDLLMGLESTARSSTVQRSESTSATIVGVPDGEIKAGGETALPACETSSQLRRSSLSLVFTATENINDGEENSSCDGDDDDETRERDEGGVETTESEESRRKRKNRDNARRRHNQHRQVMTSLEHAVERLEQQNAVARASLTQQLHQVFSPALFDCSSSGSDSGGSTSDSGIGSDSDSGSSASSTPVAAAEAATEALVPSSASSGASRMLAQLDVHGADLPPAERAVADVDKYTDIATNGVAADALAAARRAFDAALVVLLKVPPSTCVPAERDAGRPTAQSTPSPPKPVTTAPTAQPTPRSPTSITKAPTLHSSAPSPKLVTKAPASQPMLSLYRKDQHQHQHYHLPTARGVHYRAPAGSATTDVAPPPSPPRASLFGEAPPPGAARCGEAERPGAFPPGVYGAPPHHRHEASLPDAVYSYYPQYTAQPPGVAPPDAPPPTAYVAWPFGMVPPGAASPIVAPPAGASMLPGLAYGEWPPGMKPPSTTSLDVAPPTGAPLLPGPEYRAHPPSMALPSAAPPGMAPPSGAPTQPGPSYCSYAAQPPCVAVSGVATFAGAPMSPSAGYGAPRATVDEWGRHHAVAGQQHEQWRDYARQQNAFWERLAAAEEGRLTMGEAQLPMPQYSSPGMAPAGAPPRPPSAAHGTPPPGAVSHDSTPPDPSRGAPSSVGFAPSHPHAPSVYAPQFVELCPMPSQQPTPHPFLVHYSHSHTHSAAAAFATSFALQPQRDLVQYHSPAAWAHWA